MNKKIKKIILSVWQKTAASQKLNLQERIIFLFLICLEKFYQLGFGIVNFVKMRTGSKRVPFKVISVGNLSVGGTGKSVFVSMLVDFFGRESTAILLRGYGGANESKRQSLLVSYGGQLFSSPAQCGDEAYMHAIQKQTTVVVGRDRFSSVTLLSNLRKKNNIKYVVLDDAYQNHQLFKDFEILLLDARKPFENGHCLPAGALREKDLSRADAVVLTHADMVNEQGIKTLRIKLSQLGVQNIFAGKHAAKWLLAKSLNRIDVGVATGQRVAAFAGIGSFEQFKKTVESFQPGFVAFKQFADHHAYVQQDIETLYNLTINYSLKIVLTTMKDWVKFSLLIANDDRFLNIDFYSIDVVFEFLNNSEYSRFERLISKTCAQGDVTCKN